MERTEDAFRDDSPRTVSTGNPDLDQTRNQALRANEQAAFLPEASRAHMERALREDDDGEGRLARYVTTLADRNYFRAFAKWFRDPVSGGHEWSPRSARP